jgi:hypothetical protein
VRAAVRLRIWSLTLSLDALPSVPYETRAQAAA